MASLFRVAARQGCRILTANATRQTRSIQPACFISTSKKHKDSATVTDVTQAPPSSERLDEKDENWISYGYDWTDREQDTWAKNMTMFLGFSLCICWGGFVLAYMPDHRMQEWMKREAYLELARREKEGLLLIDPNLIDPAKVALPSDEDLEDREIII